MATVKNLSGDNGLLHRDEKGDLRDNLSNRRVIIFSCSAYRSMCDALFEQFQSGATVILYRMGEGYGKRLVKGVSQLGQAQEEKLDTFHKLAFLAGWGKINIKVNKDYNGEVIVEESPFLLRRNDIGLTSCHFLSGVLAGAASELFGQACKAVELRCASKSDSPICRFRIFTKTQEPIESSD